MVSKAFIIEKKPKKPRTIKEAAAKKKVKCTVLAELIPMQSLQLSCTNFCFEVFWEYP